jgi:hypothetical protein
MTLANCSLISFSPIFLLYHLSLVAIITSKIGKEVVKDGAGIPDTELGGDGMFPFS